MMKEFSLPGSMESACSRQSVAKAHKGFTMTELLVVVGIVAVMAAIAIPAGISMREASLQSNCAGNLRSLGVAFYLYAEDNGGAFPETSHTALGNKSWISALEVQLGKNYEKTRICPADPQREQRILDGGTSYVLNSYLFVPKLDPFGRPMGKLLNRPSALPEPDRTLMAFICSDQTGTGPGNDHTHSERWTGWDAVRRDISPDRFHGGRADGTKGKSNYLYADGHVESIQASEFRSRIQTGPNPALPPGT